MNPAMKWFTKCHRHIRDGVGEVHLHRRWWSRKGIVIFVPEGRTTGYPVPTNKFPALLECETWIEAMALLRQDE